MSNRILSNLDRHAAGLKLAPRLTLTAKQAEQVSSDISEAREVMAGLIKALESLVSMPVRYFDNCIEIDTASHSEALRIVENARKALYRATDTK